MTKVPIKAIPYHVNWMAADYGRMREELAQLADRGVNYVLLSPPWFRIQPRPQQIDRVVMATLEVCYDAALQARIGAVTTMLTAAYAGSLELPDWHHEADVVGWLQGRTTTPIYRRGGRVRINGVVRPLQLADPYRTDTYGVGQRELIRVVMGYFAGHHAARHWLFAPGWSYLADTPTQVAAAWWQELVGLARRVHAGAVIMAHVDAPQLLGHGFDVVTMSRDVDVVCVDTAMPILPQRHQRAPWVPMQFLQHLVAGLTQRPTVVGMHPLGSDHQTGWRTVSWYDRRVLVPVMTPIQLVDQWQVYVAWLQKYAVAGVMYPIGWHGGYDNDRDDGHAVWPRVSVSVQGEIDVCMRQWQQCGEYTDDFDRERYLYHPQRELLRLWRAYTYMG